MAVLLETSVGDIVVDLMLEERPKACLNFLKLCKVKFYNYCLFHTVKPNFIAQAGDPGNTGEGGASIWGVRDGESERFFAAEKVPRIKHAQIGTLSMVNDGNGRHSSQWFITLGSDLDYLDAQEHTVFGAVSEGVEALQKLNKAYCDKEGRPYRDIRINHTVVLDDPFPDLEGLEIPSRSPSPTAEQLKSGRIGADEELNDNEGLTLAEIEEKINVQEAAAHTTMLEIVGDLPDADVKPPDNVLFVCKLNPATTSEDLEIIFSRFGAIASCEVIKDQKSGESLQYAFVEFENTEDCEEAYFKMDNVLIDERRIHVDFSQSVAKVQGNSKKNMGGKDKPEFRLKNRERQGNEKYQMVFDDMDTAASAISAAGSQSKHKPKDAVGRRDRSPKV